jgi:hypothetical protein
MLKGFVAEFVEANPEDAGDVALAQDDAELQAVLARAKPSLIFAKAVDWSSLTTADHSIFDLSTKTYLKQRTPLEVKWQTFALGFRARFLPRATSTASL